MKKIIAILSLLLLVSCDGTSSKPALKQTHDVSKFSTEIVFVPENKIVDFCTNLGVQYEANGCSAYYHEEKRCVIYVMPQRYMHDQERLAIIGHELWHCRYGRWHD